MKNKTLHIKFMQHKTIFRYQWPPESFLKKLKRILKINQKGKSPFVKLR